MDLKNNISGISGTKSDETNTPNWTDIQKIQVSSLKTDTPLQAKEESSYENNWWKINESINNSINQSIADEREQNIAAGIISDMDADPIKFNRAKKVAQNLGIEDIDSVFHDLPKFEAEAKEKELKRYAELSPAIRESIDDDPNFIRISNMDWDKLSKINYNLTVYGKENRNDVSSPYLKDIAYSYKSHEKMLENGEKAFELMNNAETLNDELTLAKIQELKTELDEMPAIDTSGILPRDIVLNTIEILPYMKRTTLPIAGLTFFGGAVGSLASPAGSAALATTFGTVGMGIAASNAFKVETGNMFLDLISMKDEDGNGLNGYDAKNFAQIYGAISAVIEMVPASQLAKTFPGIKGVTKYGLKNAIKDAVKDKTKKAILLDIAKDYGKSVLSEGGEEAAQELVSVFTERYLKHDYNENKGYNFEQNSIKEDALRIADAGFQGTKASLLLSGVGSSGRIITDLKTFKQEQAINALAKGKEVKAIFDSQVMDDIQKNIDHLLMVKEGKDGLKSFMQKSTKDNNLFKDVYVEAEEAQAIINLPELKENFEAIKGTSLFNDIQRQLEWSKETGAPIRIGMGDYAAHIMSDIKLYNAFKNVSKTYADGITLKQIKERKESLKNLIDQGKKLRAQKESDFEYAYKNILEREVLGNMPIEQRKQIAEVNAYFMLNLAHRENISIKEVVANNLPHFNRSMDGSIAKGSDMQAVIDAVRSEGIANADKNLVDRAGSVAKKDINAIKKTLSSRIQNPNSADINGYLRLVNAISDLKLNIENMTDEDIINTLTQYSTSGELKLDLNRSESDKIKSGIFSSSEQALRDIQADQSSDYVVIGGGRVPVTYEIVDLKDIQTSHTADGKINEAFPVELQPRDRNRSASDAQINEIVSGFLPERVGKNIIAAEGAPIITPNGFVAVGNGRVMALSKVYQNDQKAEQYQSYLSNQGYDISGKEQPVLVRKIGVNLSNKELGALVDAANTTGTMTYSDSENAVRDARKLSAHLLESLDPEVSLDSAANKRFVQAFFNEVIPTTERNAFLDKDDKVTKKGIERIENALTATIIPDTRFLSVLVENPDNNIRKVTSGLAKAAPAIIALENDILAGRVTQEYSILNDTKKAVELLKRAKDKGMTPADYLSINDMFENPISGETKQIVSLFDKARSASDFSSKINDYINAAIRESEVSNGNLLGESPRTKLQLLSAVSEEMHFNQQAQNLFMANEHDKSKFSQDLKDVLSGNKSKSSLLHVKETTPVVYTMIGVPQKPLRLPYSVLKKINIEKHNVPLNVIENLPSLISDPVMIMDSITQPGSFVALIDAKDKSDRPILAIIKPEKGHFNIIPSIYGKDDFNDFIKNNINHGNVRYLDTEKALKFVRTQELQLLKVNKLTGLNKSIIEKTDVVNRFKMFFQKNMAVSDLLKGANEFEDTFYKQEAYGAYSPDINTITLFKHNNLSTLIHESGHFWLETLREYTKRSEASSGLKKDLNLIESWLSDEFDKRYEIKKTDNTYALVRQSDNQIEVENLASESDAIHTGKHEIFARSMEKYFLTNEAPSFNLRSIFRTFKRWLKSVYNDAQSLNVDISPDVKNVFDRLFAAEADIEEFKNANNLRIMFENAEKAGMSNDEFNAYQKLFSDSLEIASDERYQALTHLKLKEEQSEYQEKKKKIRDELLIKWQENNQFRAIYFLISEKIGETKLDPIILNKKELIDTFKQSGLDQLPKRLNGKNIYANDGISLEEAADFFGLTIFEFKKVLSQSNKILKSFEDTVNQTTHAELGDPVSINEIEAELLSSIHNEKRATLLNQELLSLGKRVGQKQTLIEKVLQEKAEDKIVQIKLSELKPEQYFELSQRAGERALIALSNNNVKEAYRQKEIQLKQFYLYKEAKKQKDETDKIVKRLRQIGKKEVNPMVDQSYQDVVRALLSRYYLSNITTSAQADRVGNLSLWILKQRENGYDISIPDSFLIEMNKKPYTSLTVEEFLTLSDTIKNLIHNGQEIKSFEINGKRIEKEELFNNLQNQLEKKFKIIKRSKSSAKPTKEIISSHLRSLDASLTTLGALSNEIDGGDTNGLFRSMFIRPLSQAQTMENDLQAMYSKKILKLTKSLSKETKKNMIKPAKGTKENLGEEYNLTDLISFGLNMGNKYNVERLRDGNKFSDRQLDWIKNTLQKEHWDYIQGVWDVLEEMYPLLEEHHKQISGLDIDKVFATPVQTEYGTYRGGYYPIVYDIEQSATLSAKEVVNTDSLLDKDYMRPTTNKGYTKKRQNVVKEPLKPGLHVAAHHIHSVIHDIAYRKTLRELWSLVNDPRFIESFDTRVGKEYRETIKDLLRHIGNMPNQEMRSLKAWEAVLRFFRHRATLIGLGFRITTVLTQPLGFFNSIAKMTESQWKLKGKHGGAYWISIGLKEQLNSNKREWAMANSGELRARLGNNDETVARRIRELQKNAGKESTREIFEAWSYKAIGYVDFYVATATWLGAYRQAKEDFNMKHEDAVFYADRVMIESQGTGNLKDTVKLQRGNEFYKALTMFYSFFSCLYQLGKQLGKDTKQIKSFSDFLNISARFMSLFILPVFFDALLRGEAPDEDDDESVAGWFLEHLFSYAIGTLPFARDVYSGIKYKNNGSTNYNRGSNYIIGGFKAIYKFITDDNITTGRVTKDVLNALATASGYPVGGQVADTASYFADVLSGNIKPMGISDILWGIYKGKERK